MKFKVIRYFSTFCTYEIEAKDDDEAYQKSKELPADENEIMSHLEDMNDIDEIEISENN